MEKNVVSLETAKRLKAAGFPQKTEFYWVITMTTNYHLSWYPNGDLPDTLAERNDCYAAPTAQDISDELPEYLLNNDSARFTITAHAFSGQICAMYFDESCSLDDDDGVIECECANTLAEALAKLWLEI